MVRKLDLIESKTLRSPQITFGGTLESAKLSAVREAGAPFFSLPLVSCAPCRICERDQRTTSRGKWAAVTGEPSYDRKSDSCLTPSIKGGRRLRNGRYFGGRIQLRLGVYNRAVHFRIVPGASDVEGACARASLPHWLANSCRSHNQRGTGPRLDRSGSGSVIVVQHAAQALTTLDLSRASEVASFGTDELVSQSLMIALAVVMSNEVLNGFPQRLLAEEDHAIQA